MKVQELFIYDPEQGLFKNILEKSSIIQGRYHVSAYGGQDLNTSNLQTFVSDPANGIVDIVDRYPMAVCVTPKSRYVSLPGGRWEQFFFNMFFLAKADTKNIDPDTLTSKHHIWYDWQDMKSCAESFLNVLEKVLASNGITVLTKETTLRNFLNVDKGSPTFTRISNYNTDRLSGCLLSFIMIRGLDDCEYGEYSAIDTIEIPASIIHTDD